MSALQSEFLFDLTLGLATPLDVGQGPEGHRLVVMVADGTFSGPKLSGIVVPMSGADWPRIRSDGSFALDVRLLLKTDDGALIYATYGGRLVAPAPEQLPQILDFMSEDPVDPSTYYFRTHITFETSDPKLTWLNGALAVGVGAMGHGGARYAVHRIL
uniref:UPF0311 protein Caul_5091 n=1 Tax=Caulobacter sp. (strain K31) TaxID=366602 RepID=B0T936_CAUSK